MRFEWDDSKAPTNATKHKVTFEEAATVWTDPFALIAPDPEHSLQETKSFISNGLTILAVSHDYGRVYNPPPHVRESA